MPRSFAGDEMALAHQAARREMLQSDLESRFHRLRPVRGVDDILIATSGDAQQRLGQRLERSAREEVPIAVSDLLQLTRYGGVDLGMGVPDAEDGRTARAVDVALAGLII